MDILAAYRPSLNRFSVAASIQNNDVRSARNEALEYFPEATWLVRVNNFSTWAQACEIIENGKPDDVLRYTETIY